MGWQVTDIEDKSCHGVDPNVLSERGAGTFRFSPHALQRCRARRIPTDAVTLCGLHADRELVGSDGRVQCHLTRRQLKHLRAKASTAGLAAELDRLVVIIAPGNIVVTAYREGKSRLAPRPGRKPDWREEYWEEVTASKVWARQ
ncbi:MAG TPA: hypothetical protein VEY95_05700 [Azospirillaceae bacterium]|nr:hypothetical protein [Azospirillaceae bacterium]